MSENSPSISNNQFDDFRYVIDKAMADTPVMIPYDEIYGCPMSDSVSDNLAQCLLVFDNGGELMDQFKDEMDTTLGAIYKEFNINPTWYEYRGQIPPATFQNITLPALFRYQIWKKKIEWEETIGQMGSTGYATGPHLHLTTFIIDSEGVDRYLIL